MENKSSNFEKIFTIIIFTIIGTVIGGIIAKSSNVERYNAINLLNSAAYYYNSNSYSTAARLGEIEAKNIIYIGNVVGGICGLFLGLIISALASKKKNDSEIQKDDLKNKQLKPLHINETNTSPSVSSLIRRAAIFLEDGDFDSADEYFNRVLDIDPECSKAYIGRLLVELKLKNENELLNCGIDLTEYNNYKRAVKYADNIYKEILRKYK